MAVDRLVDLIAPRSSISRCFRVIPMCGRLSWPALWSTFGRTINSID